MSEPQNLSPISIREYWILLKPDEQKNVVEAVIAPRLYCEECRKFVDGKRPLCYYCGVMTCADCSRTEIWYSDKPITTCTSCYETGMDLDAEIEAEAGK